MMVDKKEEMNTITGQSGLFDKRKEDAEWMDLKSAAAHLRTKERHLRELVYRKEIPYHKLGAKLRFERGELDRWMFSQ